MARRWPAEGKHPRGWCRGCKTVKKTNCSLIWLFCELSRLKLNHTRRCVDGCHSFLHKEAQGQQQQHQNAPKPNTDTDDMRDTCLLVASCNTIMHNRTLKIYNQTVLLSTYALGSLHFLHNSPFCSAHKTYPRNVKIENFNYHAPIPDHKKAAPSQTRVGKSMSMVMAAGSLGLASAWAPTQHRFPDCVFCSSSVLCGSIP